MARVAFASTFILWDGTIQMNKMSKLGLCHQLNGKFDGLGRIKPRYRGYFNAKLNFLNA
jgi:hypothetical protein